jgi:hypothetical protein
MLGDAAHTRARVASLAEPRRDGSGREATVRFEAGTDLGGAEQPTPDTVSWQLPFTQPSLDGHAARALLNLLRSAARRQRSAQMGGTGVDG